MKLKVKSNKNPDMKILTLVYLVSLFSVIFCSPTVTGVMATATKLNTNSNGKTTVPLRKGVGAKPSNVILTLNKKGLALLNLGKYNESIAYFDKALAINPKNFETLVNKGGALFNLGKYNESIAYFDKALAINPKNVVSLYNKGAVLNKLGKYNESIAYFDRVLAIKPTNRHALAGKKLDQVGLGIPQDPSMFGFYFGLKVPGQSPKNATPTNPSNATTAPATNTHKPK